jgi:hypothetical protein
MRYAIEHDNRRDSDRPVILPDASARAHVLASARDFLLRSF